MSSRNILASCLLAATLSGCQLFNEAPAEAPPPPVVPAPSQPAPLPPEETSPAETPAPAAPAEAKPVEPGVARTGAPTRGKLPKGVVDEKLKSAGPAIQACYERGLKAKPDLQGDVDIDFVVAPDGKVAHASAAEGDTALAHAPTVDCILGEIRKLTFPEPSGGRVFLKYPLHLEPPKPAPRSSQPQHQDLLQALAIVQRQGQRDLEPQAQLGFLQRR